MLTVPQKLCLSNWRELVLPSTPASTLGFAAASITYSAAGKVSKSDALRTSAWMIFTPSFASSRRFSSLPGRMKLSTPVICKFSADASSARASVLPANPQMPVLRIFMRISTGNNGLVNLFQNRLQVKSVFPVRIMSLKFPHVADPPDVVADAVVLDVSPRKFFAANFFAERNRLEHRAVRMAAAAHVINFAGARRFCELPERLDKVVAVDVVAHLFAFVAEHAIRPARGGAFHQIGQEAVQFRARVRRAGQAAAAKNRRLHAEVTSVFLHQNIRRNLARAKERMFRLVNGHRFVNARLIFVSRIYFPALLQFAQRQQIRRVAINLV